MLYRLFILLVVVVAIIAGVLALTLPPEKIVRLVMFRDFFDVAIPILGFGALIKYLCTCHAKYGCGCGPSCGCCNSKAACGCGKPNCNCDTKSCGTKKI